MNPRSDEGTPLTGRGRGLVRAAWLVAVVLLVGTFAAGVPVRLSQLLTPLDNDTAANITGLPPELEAVFTERLGQAEVVALESLGISQRFYAAYLIAFDVALALAGLVIGALIFWRRPDNWLTLWVSLILVLLGTNSVSPVVPSLATVWPKALWMSTGAGLLGMISNVHILFLSPDGRAVPRWTLNLAAGFTGGLLALGAYTVSRFEQWGLLTSLAFIAPALPVWLGVLGLGIWSQMYRYRHVSGPVQRQQTKWMVVGLAAVALGFVANALLLFAAVPQAGLSRVLSNLVRAPVVNGCMLLLPICLGFSILRYRLWDIDVLIRRTLIYSVQTSLLALVYFASVVVLQNLLRLLTGQRQTQLVTVVSTLAIAALFTPLRHRVQAFIDRRFYRRKYDAARTLAGFAAGARDDVELEHLSGRLVEVVQDSMQPAHVSLWLKPPAVRVQAPGERLT